MQNLNKILIIRFSSLGDVVLATPLIRILRQSFPRAKLDFLVRQEYAELLENSPKIDQLLKFDIKLGFRGLRQLKKDLKNNNYNVILDIHNNLRSRYLCMGLAGPFSKTYVLRIQKQQFARFMLVKFKINLYRRLYGRIIAVWEKYVRTARPLFGGTAMENSTPGSARQEGRLEIFLSKESEKKAKKIHAEQLENKIYLTLAPGAKHFTKRWPAEYYCEFIERIYQETKIKSVLIGGNDDIAVSETILQCCSGDAVISLAGQLSIQETAAVIKNSALLISNDSGLMHVADALTVPLIAIFGSTVEELGFFPVSSEATVIQNLGLYCRPCSHIGRSHCPQEHFRCMQEVTPEMVWQAVSIKLGLT
jgi:lipopolysaccharide heptosyltransferase II